MKTLSFAVGACSLVLLGCAADEPGAPSEHMLGTSGSFAGRYEVPTSDELANAAQYPVDHVDWTIANGTATLHYDLPLGLVGGELSVTLAGSFAPGATTVELTGTVGSGTCTANGTIITCREQFTALGALPISLAVIEAVAAREYAGPVADRVAVATVFSSDPIGIVELDLQAPVIDDRLGDDH